MGFFFYTGKAYCCEKMNKIINRILPSAIYEQGFKINGQHFPFYSFCQPNSNDAGWSDHMTEQLEIPTKSHFIDQYNRKISLDLIKDKLINEDYCFLDIGCSSGYMLEDVSKNFPKVNVMGADYFVAGLLQCHQRLPHIPLFQMDLANCQFDDNLFDAVTCLNVLEHIQDDESALKHLFRIVKPDGKLVVTVPMGRCLYDMYDQVHYHVRRYQISELKNKMEAVGFNILKSNYFGVFIYPGFYLIKQINKKRFGQLSDDKKKQIVFNQIKDSSRAVFIKNLLSIEYALGKMIKYPFGIRGYVLAQKP